MDPFSFTFSNGVVTGPNYIFDLKPIVASLNDAERAFYRASPSMLIHFVYENWNKTFNPQCIKSGGNYNLGVEWDVACLQQAGTPNLLSTAGVGIIEQIAEWGGKYLSGSFTPGNPPTSGSSTGNPPAGGGSTLIPGQGGSFSCVDHSQASTDMSAECCPGYKKWLYDAKTGIPYDGFMCWSAPFASEGQYAGPSGQGNFCFPGLVNVDGKCSPGSFQPGNLPPGDDFLVDDGPSPFEALKNPWVIGGVLALFLLPLAFKQ